MQEIKRYRIRVHLGLEVSPQRETDEHEFWTEDYGGYSQRRDGSSWRRVDYEVGPEPRWEVPESAPTTSRSSAPPGSETTVT